MAPVSKPNFATKYTFESSRRDLSDLRASSGREEPKFNYAHPDQTSIEDGIMKMYSLMLHNCQKLGNSLIHGKSSSTGADARKLHSFAPLDLSDLKISANVRHEC